MVSQSIYGLSLKLSAIFRYCYLHSCHEKMYQRNSHTGYCRKTHYWHHHTITVQGIRNDDQSLSPVTPLVCLLFLSFLIPWNVQEHFKFTIYSLVFFWDAGYYTVWPVHSVSVSYERCLLLRRVWKSISRNNYWLVREQQLHFQVLWSCRQIIQKYA